MLTIGLLLICNTVQASPNIVIFLADDQGWGDLSLHGNTNLHTPHIDSLARDGVQFEWFYVCPVCSPTRAEFLTGRYHVRGGVYSTSAGGERLDLDERTLGDVFKAAGYATGAFGKWHNGMQYPYHPNGCGFDEYYGFCSGHWGHYFSPMLEHNGKIVQGQGYAVDDFTDKALAFITKQTQAERPFLAYLPYNIPHSPMQVPDRFWQRFAEKDLQQRNREPQREDLDHTRAALAMCENIDWNVGRVLERLDQLKIAEDTIVVYFSDNGPNGWRWNGGMRGKKGSTDEGGVRSPLLIRWPGQLSAGKTVPQISAAIDLLPTLADLAAVPLHSPHPLDGKSLKPLLLGPSNDWPDRQIFSYWSGRISVRTQQYRLDHQGQLYDMAQDPGQTHHLNDQLPQVTRQLQQAVASWKKTLVDNAFDRNRPFIICHPDFPYTQLPARDATTTGTIKRSSRHPNCSYFTHWTNVNDSIHWPVTVAAAGKYQVEVYYACPAEDIGSVIELSFQGHRLKAIVTQANDPPLQGAEEDRSPRIESLVKDFKPLDMGTIDLPARSGVLTLKALQIPHAQAMEFRLLMLTRVK